MSEFPPNHPSANNLEQYALDDLPEPTVACVEEHLLICEECRQVVSELDVFAPLLRSCGRKRTSAAFAHDTEDGLIRLELRVLPERRWGARVWGEHLDSNAVFENAREAYLHIRRVFSELYPEHLCTERCGAPD